MHTLNSTAWWTILTLILAVGVVAAITRSLRALTGRRLARVAKEDQLPLIQIVQGDITLEQVGAVVNAAKTSLMGGGGVDGAIHRAGGPAILRECQQLRMTDYPEGLAIGEAIETTAGNMAAHHVIHTVGPRFSPTDDRSALLRRCYTNSLAVADALGAQSVAFPLISSGVYGWPMRDAIWQALTALRGADTAVKVVRLVVFDEETYEMATGLLRVGGR